MSPSTPRRGDEVQRPWKGGRLQIGMSIITLDVKDHCAVTAFLRCVDVKVQAAGAVPVR